LLGFCGVSNIVCVSMVLITGTQQKHKQ
jgi:hypothetical protein